MPQAHKLPYGFYELRIASPVGTVWFAPIGDTLEPFPRELGLNDRFLVFPTFFLDPAFFFAEDFASFFFFAFLAPAVRSFLIFSFSLRTRLSNASIFFFTFDMLTLTSGFL